MAIGSVFGVIVALFVALLALAVVVLIVIGLVYAVRGTANVLGRTFAHVGRFIIGMLSDALRLVGAVLTSLVYIPMVLGCVIIGRWSAAGHFGRALMDELRAGRNAVYRVVVGHPARFLFLGPALEGLERRLPAAMAEAPGSDRPAGKAGQFEGYTIVGSLPAGGSGGRLYVADPSAQKLAAFARAGFADRLGSGQVVIKSFSVKDGSTVPQIVRESRALEAARRLGLVLDHELTDERFFYVMPYVPGESLAVMTRRLHAESPASGLGDAQLRSAMTYIADLLTVLEFYHRGGLWHKDVKPDNIIVCDGRAHLVDLGLITPLRSAMTLTTHGTEYFRDPELVRMALRGAKVHEVDGVKFDVYGAGAVLFSVIENSFPAHGGLSQISKRCPEPLRWVIRRAMAEMHQRYPTAGAMLADLRAIIAAPDPNVLRPADLPSMREGGAAAVAFDAAAEMPRVNPGAHSPFAGDASAVGVGVAARGHGRHRATPSGKTASEQLASARARVQSARTRAHRRRGARFEAGPNRGVALAVGALGVVVIGGVVVMSSLSARQVRPQVVSARQGSVSISTDGSPLKVVFEKDGKPTEISLAADFSRQWREIARAASDLSRSGGSVSIGSNQVRFKGGPNGTPSEDVGAVNESGVLVVSLLPKAGDESGWQRVMWVAGALRERGYNVLGLGDSERETELLAGALKVIGVRDGNDQEVGRDVRAWIEMQPGLGAVLLVPREGPWRVESGSALSGEDLDRMRADLQRAAATTPQR